MKGELSVRDYDARLLVVGLMYFHDRAVRILQEDLIPAADGPNTVVGELNIFLPQQGLERLDIVGAKRNVTAVQRIETLFGSERDAEILRRDVKLGRAVGQKLDFAVVALRRDLRISVAWHRLHIEKGPVEFRNRANVLGRIVHVMELQFHGIPFLSFST